jgi:hypothetical protein
MPIAAALIGGAATIGGALIASHGASKAADAQTQAADQANALQKYMFDTTNANQQPWRDIGKAAIGQLTAFTQPGFDVSSWLKAQPGYQFGIDEGSNTIQRSAAAGGSLNSGGTLKALDRFGQNYASGQLNNAFNRLATLAGFGQVGNQQTAQAGQNYANQAGDNMLSAGRAQAQGAFNQSQIGSGLLGNLAGIGTNLLGQYNPYAGATALPSNFLSTAQQPITAAPVQANVPGLVTSASLPGF